ncbi:probable ADP-ribosylation factor GTPase-activating protein AGD14 isoform X2 [Gossypium raimondii]|uniref:probable ADP-ribosylation factor GTPase-activating protein AGD14 isoform X2 n=1 Tax=Gossypium raimondii TaxID=29730 RepID=UPI00227BA362|nr:probable ADP-ribosylation factor GTPase-activating protein AGD14 isoform X2 [Gossypium raimondii]
MFSFSSFLEKMGSRKKLKDDERMERTIRALLKLPENKRCINCNILGPQYVCTIFLTFVCTNCSGIHREFTHRVKSISLGKFSEDEVSALQAAGNERARQIYFKAWDPQLHSFPDGSNLKRLREFIREVYVERKYTGERTNILPSGHRVDTSESRKASVFSGRSRGPLYEDRHQWSSNEGSSPAGRSGARIFYLEARSARYAEENSRYGSSRRNPLHIEIVDNRLKSEGSRSARRHNDSFSRREPVTRSQSFSHQVDRSGSPVVRPVRDILGENAPALQVGEHSNANAGSDPDDSAIRQKNASSGGKESLIDFSMDSKPSNAVAEPNVQQVPPSSDGCSQSSDDLSSMGKAPPASNANSFEALLFDLSVSSSAVANVSAAPGIICAQSTASGQNISLDGVSAAAPAETILTLTRSNAGPLQVTTDINCDYEVKAPEGHGFPCMQQHQPSLFPASDNNFPAHRNSKVVEALNSQPVTSFLMHNAQQFTNVPTVQSSTETRYEVGVQPVSAETMSSGRKELPQDLFMASYGSAPAAVPCWQNGLPHGMGFGLQYYPNAMTAAFPSTAKTNPFESDTIPAQVPAFPSMVSLLGALPSAQDPNSLSHDAYSSGMASHSSYIASSPRTPELSFTSAMPSSACMGDQSHIGVLPSRQQEIGSFDGNNFIFSFSNITQRPMGGHSACNPPKSLPTMGTNPFG